MPLDFSIQSKIEADLPKGDVIAILKRDRLVDYGGLANDISSYLVGRGFDVIVTEGEEEIQIFYTPLMARGEENA